MWLLPVCLGFAHPFYVMGGFAKVSLLETR
jgi:hypothetical protein